jgi:hypothetical protein
MSLETTTSVDGAVSNQLEGSGISADVPPEEQQEIRKILRKFRQFKKHRDRFSKHWIDYYKLYRGVQWSKLRPTWKSSEVVNMIWQAIQSQAPLQTDVRPRFVFLPQDPSDFAFAEILEKVSDSDWDKQNWMANVLEVILDGYILGTGVSEMQWDGEQSDGLGEIVYRSIEPFYFYPDPACNDVNDSRSHAAFYAYPMATDELKRKYPDRAHLIKPDVKDWLTHAKTSIRDREITYFNSDVDLPEHSWSNDASSSYDIPMTLVIEYFGKPQDVTQDAEAGEDGKTVYKVRKAHPNGRHCIIANGVFLKNDTLPYADNLLPFSKYCNYVDPRQFWGISEIEQLESPQRVFNKILSYTLDVLLYCSNPTWLVDTSADVDTDKLNNMPGLVIEKSPGSEVRREPGSQLNPGFLQVLDRLVEWFNQTAGQSEFSQGQAPGGVTAASAIEQLISASRTRIRQKQKNLDVYLKTVGRQYMHRVLEFYRVPRIYRITEKDGSNYFMKFSVDDVQNDQGETKKAAQMQRIDLVNKRPVEGDVKQIILNGDLDIVVHAGSDLPFEAADKERKALALFDRQIIDAQEVLEQLQYPNREKILARITQLQQQAAAAAQQQAGAQQQG